MSSSELLHGLHGLHGLNSLYYMYALAAPGLLGRPWKSLINQEQMLILKLFLYFLK